MKEDLDYFNLSLELLPFLMKDLQLYVDRMDQENFVLKSGANQLVCQGMIFAHKLSRYHLLIQGVK